MPKSHPHDMLSVTNIDINCNDIISDTVEQSTPPPPRVGEQNPLNIPRFESQQIVREHSHKDYFEVRYNGQPFRIPPGETKVYPRYIAEHIAKHLADHMLQKMEDADIELAKKEKRSPRRGLVTSPIERPKMLEQILKVESWFLEGAEEVEQSATADVGPAMDIGEIPNQAMGVLRPEPPTAEEILAQDEPKETVSPSPKVRDVGTGGNFPKPVVTDNTPPEPPTTKAAPSTLTKKELIKECVELGVEVSGRETNEELIKKIEQF